MNVDSYLELFTTMLGWMFYDTLWDILTGTGLAYIPFVWLVLSNLLESHNNGMDVNTAPAMASLKRLEVELATMLFVVVLAAQPTLTMNIASLKYGAVTSVSNTSTFGVSGFVPTAATAKVPIWWSGVMSISAGINAAAMNSMPAVDNLRELATVASMTNISDPLVAEEVRQFYMDCYAPARSKYYADKPSNAAIAGALATYGASDPEWMGSHVYQLSYYIDYRASRTVPGFPYDPLRDTEYADLAAPPTWGRPYCVEWWATAAVTNLQEKINTPALSLTSIINSLTTYAGATGILKKDTVTKVVLTNSPPSIVDNKYYAGAENATFMMSDILKGVVGSATAPFADLLENLIVFLAKEGFPMLQALILMGIYALLPFILVIGSYSLEVMFVGALGLFTVKFWTFLWAMAAWVDQNLIGAMYPTPASIEGFLGVVGWSKNLAGGKAALLDLVTSGLFFILPLLWTMMMGWAGMRAFSAIGGLQSRALGRIDNATHTGVNVVKSTAGKVV